MHRFREVRTKSMNSWGGVESDSNFRENDLMPIPQEANSKHLARERWWVGLGRAGSRGPVRVVSNHSTRVLHERLRRFLHYLYTSNRHTSISLLSGCTQHTFPAQSRRWQETTCLGCKAIISCHNTHEDGTGSARALVSI